LTEKPVADWRVRAEGEESDDIPLWRALAQFSSEDLDDGLQQNAAVINQIKPSFVRRSNIAFVASLVFGFFTTVSLVGLAISASAEMANLMFFISLGLLTCTAAPQFWRQYYQYGWRTPTAPLDLPHLADPCFDEFLAFLQRASEPQPYARSWLRRKMIPIDRYHFFGKLRYFVFCERANVRALVMRFRAGWALPSDIFVHRDDLEKMIALSKPKRKGGPGRNAKYRYNDAVISLIGDADLNALVLDDRIGATNAIKNKLDQWFKANVDASGDVPRGDQLNPYAEKVFDHLKKSRRPKSG
jgi:hypothetical protein